MKALSVGFSVILLNLFSSAFSLTKGKVTKDGINLRTDSRITSSVICKLERGEGVNILSEKYDWYKIILPEKCSCYVYKAYLKVRGNKGVCTATNVNIRTKPSLDSEIVGRLSKGEQVRVLGVNGDFYKIIPTAKCYGYVHKIFVKVSNFEKEDQNSANFLEKDTRTETKPIEFIGLFFKKDGFYFLKTADKIYKIKTFRDLDKFVGKKIEMRGFLSKRKKFVLKSIKILKEDGNN